MQALALPAGQVTCLGNGACLANSARRPQGVVSSHGLRLQFSSHRFAAPKSAASRFTRFAVDAKWVLLPTGDGDTSHLDAPVALPGPIELQNDVTIVGRVADKADVVLPVATVSGRHAHLEQKDEALYVTDLDSTNGTFLDNKKLSPGIVYPVEAGSSLIFGDEHLAVFKVDKVAA